MLFYIRHFGCLCDFWVTVDGNKCFYAAQFLPIVSDLAKHQVGLQNLASHSRVLLTLSVWA